MNHILTCIFVMVFIAGCSSPHSEEIAKTSSQVDLWKQNITAILPKSWSPLTVTQSHAVGQEGVYMSAENPYVELDGPKGKFHPRVSLYFRPRSATSTCLQIEMDGSIFSNYLGYMEEYNVYGGSVGIDREVNDLDEKIKKALELKK